MTNNKLLITLLHNKIVTTHLWLDLNKMIKNSWYILKTKQFKHIPLGNYFDESKLQNRSILSKMAILSNFLSISENHY